MKIVAVDSETTGKDLWHGAKPFFITLCYEDNTQLVWDWPVDPLTREPQIPDGDLDSLQQYLDEADRLLLQNSKFDAVAFGTVRESLYTSWRWEDTDDTLIAGHLLASNKPHDLTSMSLFYLGEDILNQEQHLERCVQECRRFCRSHLPTWLIAKEGLSCMPSAKEKTWKYDTWLPKAVVTHLWTTSEAGKNWAMLQSYSLPSGVFDPQEEAVRHRIRQMPGWEYRPPEVEDGSHEYWTVLEQYANTDSGVLIPLWRQQYLAMKERGLLPIYRTRMKAVPVACKMERRGITLSSERLDAHIAAYVEESARCEQECVEIASSIGYNLTVPKGAMNTSLKNFCFGEPIDKEDPGLGKRQYLDLPVVLWTDGGNPSLDKEAMQIYLGTLPPDSAAHKFITALSNKRQRDTAVSYMLSYRRFWQQVVKMRFSPNGIFRLTPELLPGWYVLHPWLNPTGSDTLRWSSQYPNEQNISKKKGFNLRFCFGPSPGREWWSLDAKNIELRIPAYVSGQQEFIDLFESPNVPPYFGSNHLLIAHLIFAKEFDQCISCRLCNNEVRVPNSVITEKSKFCNCPTPSPFIDGRIFKKRYESTLYQRTKNGNFALQYGAVNKPNGMGTADRTYGVPGAQTMIERRFSAQAELNRRCIAFAEKHGYIETLPDKSVDPSRGYPLLCTRTEYGKIKPTVPLNYFVQGCLAGTSRVLTDQGLVEIKDLVGRPVKVWTGFKWADAVGLDRGPWRRARIILRSGLVVECDTRHKLKNEKDEWVEFDKLQPGVFVALPKNSDPISGILGKEPGFSEALLSEGEAYRYDRIVSIEVLDVEEHTYTMAVNDPLHQFVADGVIHQNSACWWMMMAMIRCQEQLEKWNDAVAERARKISKDERFVNSYVSEHGYFLVMQVHDELVFDFPKGTGPEPWKTNLPKIRALQALMEQCGDDFVPRVPTPVDIEYNPDNWSEGITIS